MENLTINVAEAVVIRPGDKVLVTFNHPITMAHAEQINKMWYEKMPNNELIMISQVQGVSVLRNGE